MSLEMLVFPAIGVWQSGVEWNSANSIAFRCIANDAYSFAEQQARERHYGVKESQYVVN